MSGPQRRKKSQNLYYRKVVPEQLRPIIGKREIVESLGTPSWQEAEERWHRKEASVLAWFAKAEQELNGETLAEARRLVTAFLDRSEAKNLFREDVLLLGIRMCAARLLSALPNSKSLLDRSTCMVLFELEELEHRDDLSHLSHLIDEPKELDKLRLAPALESSKYNRGLSLISYPDRLLKAGVYDPLLGEAGMVLAGFEGKRSWPFYLMVCRAWAEALVFHRDPTWSEFAIESLHPYPQVILNTRPGEIAWPSEQLCVSEQERAPASVSRPETKRIISKRDHTISDAFELWKRYAQPSQKTLGEAKRAVERLKAIIGDVGITTITKSVVREFRDAVQELPAYTKLERLVSEGASAIISAAKAADPNYRMPSPKTVKKDFQLLAAIFGQAEREEWIETNVFADVDIAGYRRDSKRTIYPLTDSMMVKLFASPLFTGCNGKRDLDLTKPGEFIFQDELYWFFVPGVTLGPRLNEIGQILLADIESVTAPAGKYKGRTVHGTQVLRFTKNDSSARPFVFHSLLIDLGLMEYVERRRQAGETYLFDVKADKNGSFTKELSRRVNRYIDRAVTDDLRYVFHSFRHDFKGRADSSGVSTRVNDQITGHASVRGRSLRLRLAIPPERRGREG
ncbi:hypothetical protein B5C34_11085 [Pacificimonas flava]|uniref:DUF6538 domain-containing protein n=2 Tax=Pacificimonas TaxID=1960290 RepID=A0A219B6P8_9SPHN|nr:MULTISPECIES: DUF6538 domain-containing protein [Pacificimonas]MBZ6378787.1 hypothetical protein [Pacificimonas aurantium]OWV33951.1 hypothetical protein B5C34_11085 [Pacificimonas flava]